MVNSGFMVGKRLDFSHNYHKICLQVPFFHVFGTVLGIMASLNHASTIVLPTDGYQPGKNFDAIKNEKYLTILTLYRL